ncbi:hypothetical protein [Streptomyces poriferorum]|uniref:DUF8175 domain-containing protein n=1 Tax=Streptomyces poriferorum TaxID=2798799 RepID=A0ABY9ITY1_9ACTN|nr:MULTISPECIES: hypothetical protein [unclassified Streptomyces]MDP5313522.1 hypothetical protein [Streptomyces sp. Alt4]WLQ57507.1 hypothetical protein P8A19_19520 [Streptomyces sp. Alt2]
MSHDDGYGNDSGRTGDGYSTIGGTRQTRTRLPDGEGGDGYGPRRPARNSRSLVTVVGVIVLLLGAIAFANMGGGNGSGGDGASGSNGKKADATSTAATGTKPVTGKNGEIASGFAHDQQGAQSAAANYAAALGSDGMFNEDSRREIVQALADSSTRASLQTGFDADYSQAFLAQIGLNADGSAPAGSTFVNRTMPAGTSVKQYSAETADVDVWCTGLFGLTGEKSTKPVTSGWFTVTMKLTWDGSDWKILETGQKQGPTPVTGDNPVSGSAEIAETVNGFGGFTYAR